MTLKENIAVVITRCLFIILIKLENILNDRYLSLEDSIFVENVIADIQRFVSLGQGSKKSVLIFPPVNNYRRFLIHKVCEETQAEVLSTFSVGQGFNRRTVICLSSLVRKPSLINKSHDLPLQNLRDQTLCTMVVERQPVLPDSSSPDHNCQNGSVKRVRAAPAIYRPPAARKLEALNAQVKQSPSITPTPPSPPVTSVVSKTDRTRSGTKQRRPDQKVYVPRAKRASMIDQNSSEHHNSHHEIVPVEHQICSTKKSTSTLPLKVQNTTISSSCDKESHILPPPELGNDCSSEPTLKKINIGEPVIKEDHNKLVTENCAAEERPAKFNFDQVVLNNYDSNCACKTVDCETKDICGVSSVNTKSSGETSNELKDQTTSLSHDRNGNSTDGGENNDKCKEKNCKNEINDSRTNLHEVLISDSKNSGEMDINDYEECLDHENEISGEVNASVENSLHYFSDNEKTSQPNSSSKMNNVSENKNQTNKINKKIDRRNLVSEVLIISDPEPPKQVLVPKQEENLEKNNAVTKRNKAKHKSENSAVTEKLGNNSISTVISDTTPASTSTSSVVSLNPDECTWEMLFDDNGDCLDPKIMEELTNAVGSVTIEKPQSDYNRFISRPEINLPGGDGEFAHVVEIYNFPAEFKTQDLLSIFAPYKNGGFEIKWVDDTHALGVFSSSRVAADVLAYEHPFVKTRPLSEATPESRMKARRSAEFLQPYRVRPETCVAMARRLVTGALGVKLATAREEREKERRLLKEAREKKRLAAQQQQDAWEGTIR